MKKLLVMVMMVGLIGVGSSVGAVIYQETFDPQSYTWYWAGDNPGCGGGGISSSDNGPSISGTHCLHIDSIYTGHRYAYDGSADVANLTTIYASYDVKRNNTHVVSAFADIKVEYNDGSFDWWMVAPYDGFDGSDVGDWVHREASFSAPAGKTIVRVSPQFLANFNASGWGDYANAEFDNLVITPEPATIGLVLLGVFGVLNRKR